MSFLEYINKGGAVNWILLSVLFLSSVIITERVIYFFQTRRKIDKSGNGEILCTQARNLKKYSIELCNLCREEKKEELEIYGAEICREMEKGLWLLSFAGNTAPSLGLLGTVIGLIKSFQGMANAGAQVNIQDFSAGIWEAMLTTATGLVIAIPVLFFHKFFIKIVGNRTLDMNLTLSVCRPGKYNEEDKEVNA